MKAIVRHAYGSPDILQVTEVETPTPKDDEVLIKVQATSVNAADWRMLRADPFLARLDSGLFTPRNKILGVDVAGTVEATGSAVKQFRVGDEVFGNIFDLRGGAFAEYVAAPERLLVRKPANLTFQQAAAVPLAAVTASRGLRHYGQTKPNQKVLINGASGGVGTFAVQIAKALGADVTAVVSTRNVELARSLGADHVVDYKHKDPLAGIAARYDVILAVNGYQPLATYRQALRPGGIYVMAGGSAAQVFQAMLFGAWTFRTGDRKFSLLETKPSQEDLAFVAGLIEAGQVTPVIDRCYPLEAVPEAIRYLEAGQVRGKVVIGVAG
ncbi:MAG: NAD(P)-dependent alcohol dehydrogenase [Anaerolineales bacterium]|nr:NAD(P)-dependent alcohol dehydrogenase [Anaerolineales bacterium]